MSLILQKESPSDNDLFKGKSHEKVADRMADIIEKSDDNIIGLEGELGSGKSTIIHLLKAKLGSDYTFIDFDAERYHHGNTKKALIEIIHKGISQRKDIDRTKLDSFKNQALGNIVEYDKKVSSRLSWWTVLFILLSLLSVQMVRYLLNDINTILTTTKGVSNWIFFIETLGMVSPGLLLLCLFSWGKCEKRRR